MIKKYLIFYIYIISIILLKAVMLTHKIFVATVASVNASEFGCSTDDVHLSYNFYNLWIYLYYLFDLKYKNNYKMFKL